MLRWISGRRPDGTLNADDGRSAVPFVPRPARAVEPTLIYDDHCAFCRRWVRRVARLPFRRPISFLPLDDPTAPTVAGRPLEALRRAVHFVRPDGTVFSGAAAVRELLRYVPGSSPVVAVMGLPGVRQLLERVYGWIARVFGPVR